MQAGDDTELVLLVDPGQEGLGIVVEDATSLGPVALHTSNSEVSISRHEEEMIVDELLPHVLGHAGEGVVGASEVTGQLGEGVLHEVLNTKALFLGDSRRQTKAVDGATHANAGGVDRDIGIDVS